MANTRIKDLSNTATNVASDAFIAIDGSANGTEKISRDNLRQDTADALAASPSTYNLAPLTSGSVDVDKGGTGSTTVAGAKLNLEVPDVGTAANEVPLNGMLNSGAWLDFDAFYEEGTWTPSITFGGGSTGITYNAQEGLYTRVGNQVTIHARLDLSNKGTDTGALQIKGLPFTSATTSGSYQSVAIGQSANWTGLTEVPSATIQATSTNMYLFAARTPTQLTHADVSNTTSIRFSATYQIA